MSDGVVATVLRYFSAASVCLTALCTSALHAQERQLALWEHGDWRVELSENTQWNMRSCRVWTGGDGSGTLSIHVGDGGADASVSYVPMAYRGVPSALADDDGAVMNIDGRPSWIADEMEVFSTYNEWDILEADATLSNYLVAETVQAFRAGNTVDMGGERNGLRTIYDNFTLRGFTATWLKASEWCRFAPDKAFMSS